MCIYNDERKIKFYMIEENEAVFKGTMFITTREILSFEKFKKKTGLSLNI